MNTRLTKKEQEGECGICGDNLYWKSKYGNIDILYCKKFSCKLEILKDLEDLKKFQREITKIKRLEMQMYDYATLK